MHGMRDVAFLVLLTLGFAAIAQAVGQNASIQLSPIKQIRKGIDAWPLILNPKNDAERRINGYLTNLNSQLAHSLNDCDANYIQQFGKHHKLPDDDEEAEFWRQDVKITMLGPAFLSLVATTDFYCGGAHPYGFTDAAVFDLRTGQPADPTVWFLPTVTVSFVEQDKETSALEKSIIVAGLVQAYREATHHECDDTYSDDQSFLIWPDANSGKVIIQADRLPGCCEACGIESGLTLEQARKLGFSETFLHAISDARRQLAHR